VTPFEVERSGTAKSSLASSAGDKKPGRQAWSAAQ
jgi:hypothetical protein